MSKYGLLFLCLDGFHKFDAMERSWAEPNDGVVRYHCARCQTEIHSCRRCRHDIPHCEDCCPGWFEESGGPYRVAGLTND
jgi:hypothetical protein